MVKAIIILVCLVFTLTLRLYQAQHLPVSFRPGITSLQELTFNQGRCEERRGSFAGYFPGCSLLLSDHKLVGRKVLRDDGFVIENGFLCNEVIPFKRELLGTDLANMLGDAGCLRDGNGCPGSFIPDGFYGALRYPDIANLDYRFAETYDYTDRVAICNAGYVCKCRSIQRCRQGHYCPRDVQFSPTVVLTREVPCPIGTFNQKLTSTSIAACIRCPAERSAHSGPGNTLCTDCPPGTVATNPSDHTSSCSACPVNSISPPIGSNSNTCLPCRKGTIARNNQCVPCEGKTFAHNGQCLPQTRELSQTSTLEIFQQQQERDALLTNTILNTTSISNVIKQASNNKINELQFLADITFEKDSQEIGQSIIIPQSKTVMFRCLPKNSKQVIRNRILLKREIKLEKDAELYIVNCLIDFVGPGRLVLGENSAIIIRNSSISLKQLQDVTVSIPSRIILENGAHILGLGQTPTNFVLPSTPIILVESDQEDVMIGCDVSPGCETGPFMFPQIATNSETKFLSGKRATTSIESFTHTQINKDPRKFKASQNALHACALHGDVIHARSTFISRLMYCAIENSHIEDDISQILPFLPTYPRSSLVDYPTDEKDYEIINQITNPSKIFNIKLKIANFRSRSIILSNLLRIIAI